MLTVFVYHADTGRAPHRWSGTLASVLIRRLARAHAQAGRRSSLHPAEPVELSVAHASKKCVPFARRETQDRARGILAVANPDLAVGDAGDLDAVAVGKTQGTLGPGRTCSRPAGAAAKRKSSHVRTSLSVVWLWP